LKNAKLKTSLRLSLRFPKFTQSLLSSQ